MIGGKKYSAVVVKNKNGVYEVNVTVGEQDDNSTNSSISEDSTSSIGDSSSIGSEEVDKPTPFSYGRDRKIEEEKNQPINQPIKTIKKSQIQPEVDGKKDDELDKKVYTDSDTDDDDNGSTTSNGSDQSYDYERLGYDFDGTPYPTKESEDKKGKESEGKKGMGGRTKRKRKSERRIIKKITRRRKRIKTKGTRKRIKTKGTRKRS